MAITRRRMTLDEFLELPEEKPALELVDGEVTQKVSPKMRHSVIQGAVCEIVNGHARPRKLARAFPELRSSYGGGSTVPDVSVYVWSRLPRDSSGRFIDDVFEPPDITFEILSPDQSVTEILIRCLWYVAQGVRIAVLVDPGRQVVIAFRPGAEPIALQGEGRLDLGDVIPELTLDVKALFDELLAD